MPICDKIFQICTKSFFEMCLGLFLSVFTEVLI